MATLVRLLPHQAQLVQAPFVFLDITFFFLVSGYASGKTSSLVYAILNTVKLLLGKKDFDGAKKYLETTTVEGYYTLKSIYTLLNRKKIKMPVVDLIYSIVMNNDDPEKLATFLINKD